MSDSKEERTSSPWLSKANVIITGVSTFIATLAALAVLISIVNSYSDRVTRLESDFENYILTINERLALLDENSKLSFDAKIDAASQRLVAIKDDLDKAIADLERIENKVNEIDKQAAINASKLAYFNRLSTELPDEFKSQVALLNDADKIILASQVLEAVHSETSMEQANYATTSSGIVDAETFEAIVRTAKSRDNDCDTIEDASKIECQGKILQLIPGNE